MKKICLYILLVSYTMVMVKPILPYAGDILAHLLFYKNHMATVHFENGKYHVHVAAAREVQNEKADKSAVPISKKMIQDGDHLPVFVIVNKLANNSSGLFYKIEINNTLRAGLVKIITPPPQV